MRGARKRLAAVVTIVLLATAAARAEEHVFTPAHQILGQATLLIVQGCYGDAEPLLRRSIALDPRLAEAHYNLGAVLRATGRYPEAITEYRIADRLFPRDEPSKHARSLYGIALAADAAGDPERAVAAWQDYIRFDSRFRSARPAVAIAEERLRMQELALAQTAPRPPGTQKAAR